MPISHSDQVFRLVKSLTKSEKRNFRIFAGKILDRNGLLYIKLFDLYARQLTFNEKDILKKMGGISSTQYSNLKRHLYSQILISLRHFHKEKNTYIKIREYIDFAYILYDKGLYMPALKILAKAKKLANKNHTDIFSLSIVEIEKMIQARHITRTDTQSIESLVEEASAHSEAISNRVQISNLQVLLHRYYIRKGHVTNEKEYEGVVNFFEKNMPKVKASQLGMLEKVHLFQSYVWYYYILNDFKKCYQYSLKWVELFESSEELLRQDVGLFLKGYNYLLTSAYNYKNIELFSKHLNDLENFRKDHYHTFNENTKIASFLYVHYGRMNIHFLQGTFNEGLKVIKRTLSRIKRYENYLDHHKLMILNFKIAWMYFGAGMGKKSNDFLLKIINSTTKSLREDIQIYARITHLMVHVDTDSYEVLPYLVKNYSQFVKRSKDKNRVQIECLNLFVELGKSPILKRKQIFAKYYDILLKLQKEKFSKRAFLYLDILSWLENKLSGNNKSLNKNKMQAIAKRI